MSARRHCRIRVCSSWRVLPARPGRLMMSFEPRSSRSPTVVASSRCAAETARGDRPACSSGVSSAAWAAAWSGVSGCLPAAGWTLGTGGVESAARKTASQASRMSFSEPNRFPASRSSARRKKEERPARIAGSNASVATVGGPSVNRASVEPSPHRGSSPEAISCSVTVRAYRSAWSS